MGEKLSKTLAQNKQALEAQFGGTVDLYMKDVQLCGISCCICMFEGLSSIERLWIMMLDSLSKPQVMPVSYTHLDVYKRQVFPLWAKCAGALFPLTYALEGVRRAFLAGARMAQLRPFLFAGACIIILLYLLTAAALHIAERHGRRTGSFTLF